MAATAGYINPSPGVAARQVTLKLDTGIALGTLTLGGSPLAVPALQNVTINASNDVFTWTQLDSTAKKQVATTATNSISMNIVVDSPSFFGTTIASTSTDTVAAQGILGLSRNKNLVTFSLKFAEDGASDDRYIKGQGYITGLAPTVSADSPVWVTPLTITVTGEYTVSATE
jgi:hypothetical protein